MQILACIIIVHISVPTIRGSDSVLHWNPFSLRPCMTLLVVICNSNMRFWLLALSKFCPPMTSRNVHSLLDFFLFLLRYLLKSSSWHVSLKFRCLSGFCVWPVGFNGEPLATLSNCKLLTLSLTKWDQGQWHLLNPGVGDSLSVSLLNITFIQSLSFSRKIGSNLDFEPLLLGKYLILRTPWCLD